MMADYAPADEELQCLHAGTEYIGLAMQNLCVLLMLVAFHKDAASIVRLPHSLVASLP